MRIERVTYEINWRKFRRGASFFVPCLDTEAAIKEIKRITKRLKYDVLTKIVIEDNVRGVRTWRL
jgi:hypothetical protein